MYKVLEIYAKGEHLLRTGQIFREELHLTFGVRVAL
jgi:hypothetical protein